MSFFHIGNYQAQIRSKAVSSIVQLAEIVKDEAFTSAPFINQFEAIDLGTHLTIVWLIIRLRSMYFKSISLRGA